MRFLIDLEISLTRSRHPEQFFANPTKMKNLRYVPMWASAYLAKLIVLSLFVAEISVSKMGLQFLYDHQLKSSIMFVFLSSSSKFPIGTIGTNSKIFDQLMD